MRNFRSALILSAGLVGISAIGIATAQDRRGPDSDGNGVVTRQEAMDAAAARFDRADADGNGEITKEEMKAGREKWREGRRDRRGDGFGRMDQNEDGILTENEVTTAAQDRFARMDLNGDKQVTPEEAREAWKKGAKDKRD